MKGPYLSSLDSLSEQSHYILSLTISGLESFSPGQKDALEQDMTIKSLLGSYFNSLVCVCVCVCVWVPVCVLTKKLLFLSGTRSEGHGDNALTAI